MPPTPKQSNRHLGIHVEGPAQFSPGDTISGTVNRAAHVVTPHATVTLILHGRARASLDPQEASAYRSDFRFFDTRATTLTLFDGPLHVEKDGEPASWPFVIDIPLFVHPGIERRSGETGAASYEPLDAGERPLPETFAFGDRGLTTNVDAFIEYYLEAKLAIFHNGWGRAGDATFPITLSNPRPEPPLIDFDVRPQRCHKVGRFHSHRLVPGSEDARLSSSQKVQRLFRSRQVPCLVVRYDAETPGVIQLDNPIPVPFLLRARPDWAATSDVLRGVPQRIRIDSVRVEVISYTEARAMGSLHAHTTEGNNKVVIGRYSWVDGPVAHLPFLPEDPPLNIGELMDLKVGQGRRFGTGIDGRIYAGFTAFNIKHTRHNLRWNVTVSVAGEEGEINIIKPVKVLPPGVGGGLEGGDVPPPPFVARRTESWAKPPPESEAPPAYCRTDEAQGDSSGGSSARD